MDNVVMGSMYVEDPAVTVELDITRQGVLLPLPATSVLQDNTLLDQPVHLVPLAMQGSSQQLEVLPVPNVQQDTSLQQEVGAAPDALQGQQQVLQALQTPVPPAALDSGLLKGQQHVQIALQVRNKIK